MSDQPQAPVNCVACGAELLPEFEGKPTDYQLDNALWIGFFGGYGMFVDNLDATWPVNADESQWLRDDDGVFILNEGKLIDNPEWSPIYEEARVLPGQPAYEAVICHDCAHDLCEKVPWIKQLINPHDSHSHSHQLDWTGHSGWDLPH